MAYAQKGTINGSIPQYITAPQYTSYNQSLAPSPTHTRTPHGHGDRASFLQAYSPTSMAPEFKAATLNVQASHVQGVIPTHLHTTYYNSDGQVVTHETQAHTGNFSGSAYPSIRPKANDYNIIDAQHAGVMYYMDENYPPCHAESRRIRTTKQKKSGACC